MTNPTPVTQRYSSVQRYEIAFTMGPALALVFRIAYVFSLSEIK